MFLRAVFVGLCLLYHAVTAKPLPKNQAINSLYIYVSIAHSSKADLRQKNALKN